MFAHKQVFGGVFKQTPVWFCFFITQHCSKTMPSWCHFACRYILVGREVNTIVMRVPYLWLKKRGGETGKNASALWKSFLGVLKEVLFYFRLFERTCFLKNYKPILHYIFAANIQLTEVYGCFPKWKDWN